MRGTLREGCTERFYRLGERRAMCRRHACEERLFPCRRRRLGVRLTHMESPKPPESHSPPKPFVKEGADPELISVKQLLKLLDKAAKSARTYGAKNPVAQRFFQQFYDNLTTHLEQYARLAFLVQGNQLFFKDEVVDRKSTRLNSSHQKISYAVFC